MVREATIADLERIEAIVVEAYSPYIARTCQPPGPMSDDYAARIADGTVFVADGADGVVGLIVLVPRPDHLLLDNIAVSDHARGRGVGRALLTFAEMQISACGLKELRLYTHETMTKNQEMYHKFGWTETGRGAHGGFRRVFFRKRFK